LERPTEVWLVGIWREAKRVDMSVACIVFRWWGRTVAAARGCGTYICLKCFRLILLEWNALRQE
jgi:hypothetical protein